MSYGTVIRLQSEQQPEGISRVAGSSAGSAAACAMATGAPPDEFVDAIQSATDKSRELALAPYGSNHPMRTMQTSGRARLKNPFGIIAACDEQISKAVYSFLNQPGSNLDITNLAEAEQERVLSLANSPFDSNRTEGQMITFKDIEILRKVKVTPNPFKELTITVWDATHGRQLYCNHENTPNMPVAYAAGMSMLIPPLFQSLKVNFSEYGGRYSEGPGECVIAMDGGIGSNTPVEAFFPKKDQGGSLSIARQIVQTRVQTFIFDEGGDGYKAISNSRGFQYGNAFQSAVARAFGANTSVKANRAIENEKLNETGNIIVVPHADIKTTTTNPSENQKKAAKMMAEAWVWKQLAQHRGELAQIELVGMPPDATPAQVRAMGGAAIEQAAKCLSMGELQAIVNQETSAETALERIWREACADEIQRRTNSQ